MKMDSAFQRRAALRRATWTASAQPLGTPKDQRLEESMSMEARFAALDALNRRAFAAAGLAHDATSTPRCEWPGEVFTLRGHG